MANSAWKINNSTLQQTAGTGMQPGFAGYKNNLTGKLEAKINIEGPALSVDVTTVQQDVVERANEMVRDLPEQEQFADLRDRIAETRKQLEHLSWLREELGHAEQELNAFQDFSKKDAGAQLVVLKKRVEELRKEIAGIEQDNPHEVLRTLQGRLNSMPATISIVAKNKLIPAAIKEISGKLLTRRNELVKQLEQACAPLLTELTTVDVQYHKLLLDLNLPFIVEQKIKEAMGYSEVAMAVADLTKVNEIVAERTSASAMARNSQQRYGVLPAEQKSVVGLQS